MNFSILKAIEKTAGETAMCKKIFCEKGETRMTINVYRKDLQNDSIFFLSVVCQYMFKKYLSCYWAYDVTRRF